MDKPELLSPAGDPEKLSAAILYGADAVYLAGNAFGMRAAAGNFNRTELADAAVLCKQNRVALHVTCNTVPRDDELPALPDYLEFLNELGVDALIVADLGVFRMAQNYAPNVKLHVSTQAGVVSYAAASAWQDLGASRVILARELSLDAIAALRTKIDPALELEAFVHGSMCVSHSGRCLLSEYMTGRDANRGACAQPCRYEYALMESRRPGEYFPIEEEGGETFLLNARDLCMLPHLPELLAVGLNSLKIEGRGKSAYYAASVTAAYRHGIDAAYAGLPLAPSWLAEGEKTSHRPHSTGFYFGAPGQYTHDSRYLHDWMVVAVVDTCGADGSAVLSLRNKFFSGEMVELLSPVAEPVSFPVTALTDAEGLPVTEAKNLQVPFCIKLPHYAPPGSLLRVLESPLRGDASPGEDSPLK